MLGYAVSANLERLARTVWVSAGHLCCAAVLAMAVPAHAGATWTLNPSVVGTPARLSVSASLVVADADRGHPGVVFVAATLPDGSLYGLSNGSWSRVSGTALPVYFSGTLGDHALAISSSLDATSLAGTIIYAGYGSSVQEMLDARRYAVLYTVPGSYAGSATAGDWLTFSLNVQDFAYPDRSAATVDRVISLHERYQLPLDVYLTDTMLATFEAGYPALLTRLRSSPYVALNYHVRPPKPYYAGYDWASLWMKTAAEQLATIRDYESHVTDPVTGLPGGASGGFARLVQYTTGHPVIASLQADPTLYPSVAQVFRELGATMTVSHSAAYVNLGTTSQGLTVRPEHADLKLYQSPGQSAGGLIEAGLAAARAAAGATNPYVVGVKMHDNDFFALASAWTTTYGKPHTTPPWALDTKADLKSDADMQAQWTLYEEALAWAQGNRTRVASVNALGMGAALAAAPATPLLLVSGTMHIESSPLRWPDPDKLIAFFQRATAAGRVGNQATGMRWSIGADVGWLDGEARAAEVIRTLSALGVEWDVHVHSPADAAGAAQRIVALGGTPNTVLSGVKTADIERFRSAQPGTTGYSWQAQSLWGVVREGNHGPGSEDLSSGLWQPRSSSDWMAHDPSASGLAIVGGGSRDLAGAESLAARLTQGSYTAPVYSATVMVDQVTLTVSDAVNATTSSDGIEQIEAFANRLGVLPQVRWATLSGAAAAWRAAGSIPSRVTNTQ